MQILVVDDKASLRDLVSVYVQDSGHTVVGAESGEQALKVFADHSIDLILMDVEMPGMDGFETTRKIRELSKEDWIPIIFLSGITNDSHYQKGVESGGDDYLTKPVSPVILKAKLTAMERIIGMKVELQKANETLEQSNLTDPLTQITNRRGFEAFADRVWRENYRSETSVSIIMIDIDNFKLYNDGYGHLEGDECLKKVSQGIAKAIQRPCDMVSRFGGEEFIAILPDTDLDGAKLVAEQMRGNVESLQIPHEHSPSGTIVTISVGVCCCNDVRRAMLADVTSHADKALYKAKTSGRNRVECKLMPSTKKILIVDDDKDTLTFIEETLSTDYEVDLAHSGELCLQRLQDSLPDLILCDINMPEMNGLELCKSLKEDERTKSIPVLFMSNHAKELYKEEIRTVGGSGFIAKPMDEKKLFRKMQSFLA